jgi:hypothetical protein
VWQDKVNATFELFGGLLIALHCRKAIRDKEVRGTSLLAVAGFAVWGFWNLYYYPALDQWTSFVGGLGVVGANTAWAALIIRYRRRRSRTLGID